MKLKLMMLVSLFAIGFAGTAIAGNVADADSDGVPDTFDNCVNASNGPNSAPPACTAQQNADGDALGDSCDADYLPLPSGDGVVNTTDFGPFFSSFLAGVPLTPGTDANCDGVVNTTDFGPFFSQFLAGAPG